MTRKAPRAVQTIEGIMSARLSSGDAGEGDTV
jgi:hypothetical protein